MKIIVDTNLWISFLIGKKLSTLRALLSKPGITIYVCDNLINEFKDVSSRGKIRKYISKADIEDTLELIGLYCTHVTIRKKSKASVRDAKDLYLLSLADTVHADYILTGDKDLLTLESYNQTKIVTYTDFSTTTR